MIGGEENDALFAEAARRERLLRDAANGVIALSPGDYVLGVSTRWTRFRPKLKRAAPSLLLLAGCGVWAFAPQLMNSVGIALFTLATLLNLIGCVR